MKRIFHHAFITALVLGLAPSAFSQTDATEIETNKRAQTGMKFLSVSVDARSAALGDAVTAETVGSSVSLFYNPASMAGMPGNFHLGVGQTQFIADFKYNILSASYRPSGSNFGVVGLSVVAIDYGDFIQTVRAENDAGFVELGTYSPTALAVGLGYARSFSDRFSVGGHVKYVTQDFGSQAVARNEGGNIQSSDFALNTVAVDFGILYKTGFRSLTLAMSTRNFSQELTYVRENFELPLTFQIGLSMNLIDLTGLDPNQHKLMVAVDAARPRDFSEHLKFGAEYVITPVESVGLALRAGMGQDAEEQGLSLGGGLKFDAQGFMGSFDYAYTDFGLFGNLNRLSLQLGF